MTSSVKIVYLPPERLDKCTKCGKAGKPKFCSKCVEVAYCSTDCQKEHWSVHRPSCGKNDRIDLATFYPFLAVLTELFHVRVDKPVHPALRHVVLNEPCPGTPANTLPDGTAAKLAILGDELTAEQAKHPEETVWWPLSPSTEVFFKLRRRIRHEGYVPHTALALCIALLAELYTTTVSNGQGKRIRLRYRTQPIADFGIARGAANVQCQDELAYCYAKDAAKDGPLNIWKCQDPRDHYWIYFKTNRGEEVTLDCSMYPFNMCMVVPLTPYRPPIETLPVSDLYPWVPAYFRDRLHERNAPSLYKETKRFSVLHNEKLHAAVRHLDEGLRSDAVGLIVGAFKELTGVNLPELGVGLLCKHTLECCDFLRDNIRREDWKRYPPLVIIDIEADPGETDDFDDPDTHWAQAAREWMDKQKAIRAKRKAGKKSGGI